MDRSVATPASHARYGARQIAPFIGGGRAIASRLLVSAARVCTCATPWARHRTIRCGHSAAPSSSALRRQTGALHVIDRSFGFGAALHASVRAAAHDTSNSRSHWHGLLLIWANLRILTCVMVVALQAGRVAGKMCCNRALAGAGLGRMCVGPAPALTAHLSCAGVLRNSGLVALP